MISNMKFKLMNSFPIFSKSNDIIFRSLIYFKLTQTIDKLDIVLVIKL